MKIMGMRHGIFDVSMFVAIIFSFFKKMLCFCLNLMSKFLPFPEPPSLFNICSSCGGLYLEVLLGKPAHNVNQM